MAQRKLTLIEELEKLEQSITLTLQAIDHNFSHAHRIVTGKVIPMIEQYTKVSDAVWEGSIFWRQFFEASANISLSGYEESVAATNSPGNLLLRSPQSIKTSHDLQTSCQNEWCHSSHDNLSYEIQRNNKTKHVPAATVTPGKVSHVALTDISTFESSSLAAFSIEQYRHHNPNNDDHSLHRMGHASYRIAAIPHALHRYSGGALADPLAAKRPNNAWQRLTLDSPILSPEAPAPQLHASIISPFKIPRTPEVSVYEHYQTPKKGVEDSITWDSDGDCESGLSPPTMQYRLHGSRLLQTPAQEASKRIVEDLLLTAGGEDLTNSNLMSDSPSMVQRNSNLDNNVES